MIRRTDVILLDTNVIIEAVRIGRWKGIANGLHLETVTMCEEEAFSGKRWEQTTTVPADLSDGFKAIHPVSEEQLAAFILDVPGADSLDVGEQHLLAHAYDRVGDAWVLASPDRAAIHVAVQAKLGDLLVSLERILEWIGESPPLREHFTERWLSQARTRALLS